jgi:hypothetical protein
MHTPITAWNDFREVRVWTSDHPLPNFVPRTLADGRVCCGASKILCDGCYQTVTRANLGLAAENAPDPYAKGIDTLRGEHIELTATLDPRHRADPSIPPDPYMLGIALRKAKKETR